MYYIKYLSYLNKNSATLLSTDSFILLCTTLIGFNFPQKALQILEQFHH